MIMVFSKCVQWTVSIKFFATALLSSTLFYLKVNFISPWMRAEKNG